MERKRALWLHNHTALRAFEVPALIELGYEVYCPKVFQYGIGDFSGSIEWKYDETLTIPLEALSILNRTDFYAEVSSEVKKIINEYFDVAFFHYFPDQFKMLIRDFRGTLVFQAFGLLMDTSYTQVITDDLGINFLTQIEETGERFWFAQAYPDLSEIECRFFKSRTVDLPLGLAASPLAGQWVGGDPRLFFVCPRINVSTYFKQIYRNFKTTFKDFDYIIGGAQPISIQNDKSVIGYVSKEQHEYNMTRLAVMFYSSTEKRHIHYHPFEAIQVGMPLLFMGGGLMDALGGKSLPGRCMTEKEAKRKAARLIKADVKFIKEVTAAQRVLLKHFDPFRCLSVWESALRNIEKTYKKDRISRDEKKTKKIGVIMPQGYTGGVLDYSIRLLKAIKLGARECGDSIQLVFGYPEDPIFKEQNYFKELEKEQISIRSFRWDWKSVEWVTENYKLREIHWKTAKDGCLLLNDGGTCFEDCDFLIFTTDMVNGAVYTTKSYAVVTHDFIQRYLPQAIGEDILFLEFQRLAEAVFVTTVPTLESAMQYAGVKKEKIHLNPLMFDLVDAPHKDNKRIDIKKDYFLWSTNIAPHMNHKNMLYALIKYYANGGKLKCYLTGINTHYLNHKTDLDLNIPEIMDYVKTLRLIISKDNVLRKNIKICGKMHKEVYLKVLSDALFVVLPGYADNGNSTAVDAACLGVPTVSGDYPDVRYINNLVGLNMVFFDPFDPDSIAEALNSVDKNHLEMSAVLPGRDKLEQFTVKQSYREQYAIIRNIL